MPGKESAVLHVAGCPPRYVCVCVQGGGETGVPATGSWLLAHLLHS